MFRPLLSLFFLLFTFQVVSAAEFGIRGQTWPLPNVSPPPRVSMPSHPPVVKNSKERDIYRLPIMRDRKADVLTYVAHVKLKKAPGNGTWLFIEAGQMSKDVYDQYGAKANVIFLYGNKTPSYLKAGNAQVFRANDVLANAFGVIRIPSVVIIKNNAAKVIAWK